jgi:diguanylate cyclase (GGDEF)-like protein
LSNFWYLTEVDCGDAVYRVLADLATLPDYRLVLLGLIACAPPALTAFHCYAHARECGGPRRVSWLLLTGATGGAAIWAIHFLAAHAHRADLLTSYEPSLVVISLLLSDAVTTVGFAAAGLGSRRSLIAGGVMLGVAIAFTHVLGMQALVGSAPVRSIPGVVAAFLLGTCLGSAALFVDTMKRGKAPWAAAGLLALAICGAHFCALAVTTFIPVRSGAQYDWSLTGPSLAVFVAGTAIVVMLAARVALLIKMQGDREALVRNQQLLEELRTQNLRFSMALTNMPHGLCMVDAARRLVVCNKRYSEMYRLPAALARPGTSIIEILDHRLASGICAPHDVDEYRRERLGPVREPSTTIQALSDGRVILVSRHPMDDGGWIAIHQDMTERERLNAQLAEQNKLLKQGKEELRAQNEKFDVALATMTQGLAMFDADERLVIANDRYAEIYGLNPEHIEPGTTLRQIVEHRIAKGLYAGLTADDVLAMLRERIARRRANHLISRPGDGRVLSVSLQPRAEGGWVVTVHDITEREALNARLAEQNKLLKEQEEQLRAQNIRMDAALNNMVQGLAMYDAVQNLVMCNKRYVEMYDLPFELVKPGTSLQAIIEHRMARGEFPGKNVDELIHSMLERLSGRKTVHYTSQLSDGRVLAVSVQPMADGGTVTTHHDITDQRRSEAKIVHMALHDTLTGLPNRVLLNERLEHGLSRLKRSDLLAVHLLDLDHFKTVNDALGHPVGDKLLKMVADRLQSLVGDSDTIARMGGDEFAILQVGISQPGDVDILAHRILDVVSQDHEIDGHHVVAGTSVGIAVGPADGSTPDQLIRNADLALYRAKGDGRGTFRFFERGMDAQMQQRRAMESDLRKALVSGEFELHYQPVVNLQRNEISGFEALIRWRHHNGMVPPDTFIPLAEEIGFIVPLGEWVIREACTRAARWPTDLKIAVNLSPVQFRSPGLVQVVISALAASGLAADRLELEITETVLLDDSEATLAVLFQLRELGVRIVMDDFGTGYSSLSYLQSFPFDKIKIDSSFVRGIGDGAGALNIVRAVTAMASGLGMTTTAEGVETRQQLEAVKAEGCTEIQGHVFSAPLPAEEVELKFLSKRAEAATPDRNAAEAA